jgi:hypothetical protein
MGNKKNKRVVKGTGSGGKSSVTLTFGEDDGRMPQPKSGGLTYEEICRLRDSRHKREAAAVAAAAD